MEINLETKNKNIYREIFHLTKRTQESAESVVPDTDEDIGKIASVKTDVMLKSKDITSRGVIVTGEASASLMYITDDQASVSFVKLSKGFSIEYEIPDIDGDTVAQVSLTVANAEARVLNPRKVSVTFELAGELSCYRQENLRMDTDLPCNEQYGLHARYEDAEIYYINAAAEKTLTINEQFVFPGGKPAPARLISQEAELVVTDSQLIGTKIIVKGNANISACYLSAEECYPIKAEFSTPFSQIIDIGEESMELCSVCPALTSAYYNLTETISGDKALDAEIHAVIQIVSHNREKIRYISDVYSNIMPALCSMQNCQYSAKSEVQRTKLSADEHLSLPDDCADVLSAFVSIAHISQEQSKISIGVSVDMIYRSENGQLSSAKRSIGVEGELPAGGARVLVSRLTDVYIRPDGKNVEAHLSVDINCFVSSSVGIDRVETISLDEKALYDLSRYPTVTLVRAGKESMWELAKAYHSNVEKIAVLNQIDGDMEGKLLLIPKAL